MKTLPLAPLTLLALGGCSAVVGDIGSFTESPYVCLAEPALRQQPRPLRLTLEAMEPHAAQTLVASVVREDGSLEARAIFLPTGAAATGPRRLVRDDRTGEDQLRCRAASAGALDLDIDIPGMVAADPVGGGPYQLDFWANFNRNASPTSPYLPAKDDPGDHLWVVPVCDDGHVVFRHNTMFRSIPISTAGTGDFELRFTPAVVLEGIARIARPGITEEDRRARAEIVTRFSTLPLTVTVQRQMQTVGYLRTELDCLEPDATGQVHLIIPGIVDGETFHEITYYLDAQRNGVYDDACDPICRGTQLSDTNLLFTPGGSDMDCDFPDAFFESRCATP